MRALNQVSNAYIAFASHGFWQVAIAPLYQNPQASDKTPLRSEYAPQKPFAGARLWLLLGGPLGSWGQYSCLHGSYTFRWPVLWLGKGLR